MMRLYVEIGGNPRSIALTIDDDTATVGELSEALGLTVSDGLIIDGRAVAADVLLVDAPLVHGAVIGHAASRGPVPNERVPKEQLWIGVTAGPDAGAIEHVDEPAIIRLGRNSENQLVIENDSVSAVHAELRWDGNSGAVVDLGSRNGTWVDGESVTEATRVDNGQPIRLGSSQVQLRPVHHNDRPLAATAEHANDAGRILINRPPRASAPAGPTPLALPDPIEDRENPKLSIVALIVPIIFAAVMVTVTGRLTFALFALLSPVMYIGNYISSRRKVAGERRSDVATHAAALERLAIDLAAGIAAERERRRHLGLDMVEVRRRVVVPSNRLWERRATSEDALIAQVGRGTIPWTPPLAEKGPDIASVADDVRERLDAYAEIDDVELLADLSLGVLGIHGDLGRARALTRALALQLGVTHGPADLRIAVLTTEERVDEWSWVEWLPHASSEPGPPLVLYGDGARRLSESLLEQIPEASSYKKSVMLPRWLLLVDDVSLVHERASALRQILENVEAGIHGVVLADRIDQLPASTAQVLAVEADDGQCSLGRVDDSASDGQGLIDSVSIETATEIARTLARFDDPEVELLGGGLPDSVSIRDILCGPAADEVVRRWQSSASKNSLAAPLGIGIEGPVVIDMTLDGPHGLVAGTTGAGKSELLRTMVIGLAVEHSPDDLVFVLVDYKGGSAFDVCISLPHVVGIVTDLDEHLSQRALRSLDAELHHRELTLRDAEAKDIFEYRDLGSPRGPLPRLMVVIDEFATLRAELPDFVSALVAIAQRGRSLGVHLILATQRPSGAVDANIKANTNLRIALRVQDSGDSADVIDVGNAAELPRTLPGRAYIRRGEGDLSLIQTAYASGAMPTETGPRIRVRPIGMKPETRTAEPDTSGPTNLANFVDACVVAGNDYEDPRRPWLDPLPDRIDAATVDTLADLASPGDESVTLGIGDDPDEQRWIRVGWEPTLGHLGVIGALGSGVTTTVRSAVVALAQAALGRDVWVYAADHSARGLAGIDAFPHVAPLIDADDEGRHQRLLSLLTSWIDERSQMPRERVNTEPLIVVAVDGIAGFVARNDLANGTPNDVLFTRILRDGPALGIVFIVGATNAKELPRSLRGGLRTRVVLEQLDPNDYIGFGLRLRDLPTFRPGLAVLGEEKHVAQIIDWSSLVDPESQVISSVPTSVDPLAALIPVSELDSAVIDSSGLSIPIGIENQTRTNAILRIRPGEHATIAGPPQSGRSTALTLIARQLRASDASVMLVGVGAGDLSAFDEEVLDGAGTAEDLRTVLEHAKSNNTRRWIVLVDDADRIDGDVGPLQDLARSAPLHVTVIATVRSSAARAGFGHWTRQVRASGVGVILQPDNSVDGEILAIRLPRTERLEQRPGRGYLVQSSTAVDIQLAH